MSKKLLSYPEAADRCGLSRTHISRMVAAGTFPVPVETAPRRVAFVEAEVEAWIEARIAERDTPEAQEARKAKSAHFREKINARWSKTRVAESAEG